MINIKLIMIRIKTILMNKNSYDGINIIMLNITTGMINIKILVVSIKNSDEHKNNCDEYN